jgi:hypothetical protein
MTGNNPNTPSPSAVPKIVFVRNLGSFEAVRRRPVFGPLDLAARVLNASSRFSLAAWINSATTVGATLGSSEET